MPVEEMFEAMAPERAAYLNGLPRKRTAAGTQLATSSAAPCWSSRPTGPVGCCPAWSSAPTSRPSRRRRAPYGTSSARPSNRDGCWWSTGFRPAPAASRGSSWSTTAPRSPPRRRSRFRPSCAAGPGAPVTSWRPGSRRTCCDAREQRAAPGPKGRRCTWRTAPRSDNYSNHRGSAGRPSRSTLRAASTKPDGKIRTLRRSGSSIAHQLSSWT